MFALGFHGLSPKPNWVGCLVWRFNIDQTQSVVPYNTINSFYPKVMKFSQNIFMHVVLNKNEYGLFRVKFYGHIMEKKSPVITPKVFIKSSWNLVRMCIRRRKTTPKYVILAPINGVLFRLCFHYLSGATR